MNITETSLIEQVGAGLDGISQLKALIASGRKPGILQSLDFELVEGHGHMLQFQDVLKAIKAGKQPLIDGPEGRKAVELILAIYKSAETGKPVKLPLAGDPALKARALGKK